MKLAYRVITYVIGAAVCALFEVVVWPFFALRRKLDDNRLIREREKWPCEPPGACHPDVDDWCWTHSRGERLKAPKEVA